VAAFRGRPGAHAPADRTVADPHPPRNPRLLCVLVSVTGLLNLEKHPWDTRI